MRRLSSVLLLILVPACGNAGDDETARSAAPSGPSSPADRVAAWQAEMRGEPLPATLAFDSAVPDSTVAAFLARHPLRPTQAFVRSHGLIGVVAVDTAGEAAALLTAVRQETLDLARARLCGTVARIRGMYSPGESQLTLPGGDLDRARVVLAAGREALEALRQIPAGTPLIWALEVSGAPGELTAAAGDPLVRGFEPAALETLPGGRRAVVPDPVPPAAWALTDAGDPGDEPEDRVRAGFDAVLAAARSACTASLP